MPVKSVKIPFSTTKEKVIELCTSLIKIIEQKSNQDIFINLKIRLMLLRMKLVYDNNYSQRFIIRSYDLCSELKDMLGWIKIEPDIINDIEQRFDIILDYNIEPILNSVDFYTKQIDKFQSEIEDYKKKFGKQKAENDSKVLELQSAIETLKSEKETVEKQNEAINNWKNKISEAFKGLDAPINKLNEEHSRLVWLYDIYKKSSIGLVVFLVIIEIIVYLKIVFSDTYPTWEQYLPMALPVPVTLGLLWGFITQMNRAQRQMVVISNKIHEIKYTEGLLQALNTLSVDIGESMSKINDAISRLIDNHLHNMDTMKIDETNLSKIEKQYALPIEQIPELIKLINKSKE